MSALTAALTKRALRKAKREERKRENAALSIETGQMTQKEATNCVKKNGKRGRKKKSPSLSKLKKELWKVLRQVVYSWSPLLCQACGAESAPVACHIVPSHEGAATRFFLPNLYRGCNSCNKAEQVRRVLWVSRHEEIFGKEYVEALREMSRTIFDMDKAWVLEQTDRMRKILEGK